MREGLTIPKDLLKEIKQTPKTVIYCGKEILVFILALQHFEVYVTFGQFPVEAFTEHNLLTFLSGMKNKHQWLTRWILLLQE